MSLQDFDRYCDEHKIQPGEEPAAFAAWLHEKTGWDGPMGELPLSVEPKVIQDPPVTEVPDNIWEEE